LDTETAECDGGFPDHLDARRRIERYLELKQLRDFLDDPEFDYDFN
jgi:hypothetical protein